jgi:prepilin-type N-terminal cleavage/methylation domain-containing protein
VIHDEGGFSLVELLVVMAILGVVVGGIVTLFAAGINADADQNRRYSAQSDARVALDKMRREVHAACSVSNPSTYNTPESSITLYFPSGSTCASGSNSVSWCVTGGGTRYALYRIVSTSCTGATAKYADFLTTNNIFDYLPPNSHLNSTTSLGTGTGGITLADNTSFTLPRLHVDLTVNRKPTKSTDAYRLVDDIVFRNGVRQCASGSAC